MKTIVLILLLFLSNNISAQNKYISPSIGYSSHAVSYSLESGICYSKTWIALGVDYTPKSKETYVGFKFYYKILEDKNIFLYSYNAFKSNLKSGDLYFEPGTAFNYNGKLFSPQLTASIPISESGKAYLSYSLSINLNF